MCRKSAALLINNISKQSKPGMLSERAPTANHRHPKISSRKGLPRLSLLLPLSPPPGPALKLTVSTAIPKLTYNGNVAFQPGP
ncbi:hypothetical protein BLNAU_11917 [Blattamonas nauphoetae]|uniref:Uncharacterized protein n=1 Tax=Blattamonas nauphoetae TaxID=2049346 RepID=A0ABQ9XM54_9EUKA|nr:hypothetical protein BLNAU_11917 [Blattamonas nauphoetae]